MKRIISLAMATAATFLPALAQETLKTLYEGSTADVTWESPMKIEAEHFRDGVKPGDYISITFGHTTDVIELKADGTWLPGTRFTWLGDNTPDMKTYITADMLDKLREHGLELCGASFSVSNVSICNDGFNMPEGAVWGGYFWVDNWNTIELFKTAFDNYQGQRYLDIYLSDDNEGFSGYFMKALTAWDNPEAVWADNGDIMHEGNRATIDLKDIDVKAMLGNTDRLMIQSNPEGGKPYNLTAVVLRSEDSGTGVENITQGYCADKAVNVYSLQGTEIRRGVSTADALSGLPAGVYLVNGRKVIADGK